ncbi:MAG TPA: alpha/beta fold hydrolase [Candidatus Paceibacterota bacterium]
MTNQPDSNLNAEAIPPIRTEEVKIPEGEIELAGTMFYPRVAKEKNPAVLFVHGWKSSQVKSFDVARSLAEEGNISLTFNLREHGDEGGNPSTCSRKDFLDDTRAAYDFLAKKEGVDPDNITVVGTSMGAYLAMILSEERKFKQLAFRVPANYQDEGFEEPGIRGSDFPDVVAWRKTKHDWSETRALKALHGFSGDVLIVESGKDEMVPHATVESYVDAVSDKEKVLHVLMADVGHSIRTEDEKNKKLYRDIVGNWIKSKNV